MHAEMGGATGAEGGAPTLRDGPKCRVATLSRPAGPVVDWGG